MKRLYEEILAWHLANDKQMIFLAGPRQVGKTTISQLAKNHTDYFIYLNWDKTEDRQIITQGVDEVAKLIPLSMPCKKSPILVFDEIHKYTKWKNFLKGFYDSYKEELRIIVTGSAKLDIYKRGADSLMGRYFPYHIHPISIAECLSQSMTETLIQQPQAITNDKFNALWKFGGFPEPFLKQNTRFYNRWISTRNERLFEEEIRSLTQIQEVEQMEIFAELLKSQIGNLLNRSVLSNRINIAVTTSKRWLSTLEKFYYIFSIKPWTKNITRSLTKEPKIYLWDWSEIKDLGKTC